MILLKYWQLFSLLLITLNTTVVHSQDIKFAEEQLIGKGSYPMPGETYKLQEEAHLAYQRMVAAAKLDSVYLKVVSSYRSYAHQNRIWERKYKRYTSQGLEPMAAIQKIIAYSTIPGTSRHHWGTDLDLIDSNVKQPKDVLLPGNFDATGPYCRMKEWMDQHAATYGFYLVYTDTPNRKGFKYEPWHYSYKALSQPMLESYLTLNIVKLLEDSNLLGIEAFTPEFIKSYISEHIMDINPILLP